MSDRDGDELHSSLIFLVAHDEGGVFLGLLCKFDVAAEVYAESDFYENVGAYRFVIAALIRVINGRHASGVYEVTLRERRLDLFSR